MEIGHYTFSELASHGFRGGTTEGLQDILWGGSAQQALTAAFVKAEFEHGTLLRKGCAVVKRGGKLFQCLFPKRVCLLLFPFEVGYSWAKFLCSGSITGKGMELLQECV